VAVTRQPLFVLTAALWPSPGAIPVCWETNGFEQEKGWVADSIRGSWEAAAPAVHFVGWKSCTAGEKGVRIAIRANDPEGPHVRDFGQKLDGIANGVVLDFEFTSGDFPMCTDNEAARQRCIRSDAIHEFGHVLGFLHEQERPDTPTSCPDREPDTGTGVQTIGAWDVMSLMNYCFPNRITVWPTKLSPTDQKGVQEMYPGTGPASTDPTGGDGEDDSARDRPSKKDGEEEDEEESSPKRTAPNVPASGCTTVPLGSAGGTSGMALVLGLGLGLVLRITRRRPS
jgi:hypothetical protein